MANAPEIAPAPPLALETRRRARSRLRGGGGGDGNERLTSAAGAALIVLLAVIGVTILQIHPLLSVHMFVGMLLIAPVALKLGTTGYRFVRYYAGNTTYRLKGPPAIALRLLAPAVVLTTVIVFASGVALLFAGPSSRSTWLPVHKVSFIVWLAVMTPHVLGHLPGMPALLRADYGPRAQLGPDVPGRSGRRLALGGVLVAGLVLALLTIPQFGPWLGHFHGDH